MLCTIDRVKSTMKMMCATFMEMTERHNEKAIFQKRQETILTGNKRGELFIFGKRFEHYGHTVRAFRRAEPYRILCEIVIQGVLQFAQFLLLLGLGLFLRIR